MKKALYFIIPAFVVFGILAFGRLNAPCKKNVVVEGIVSSVSEGGVKDAIVKLEEHEISYYINRGLENQFTLESLTQHIVGKKVTIHYADRWTLLAPLGTDTKAIKLIEVDQKVLYSDLK
ncbi:MAG: hypothetical protein EOO50_04030 [Flavobacterium sp.]|uniref:hypothetical protein n=1 Tax=Flavobacterium sp. TaxID=239 RepID=UPI00121F8495|nr:hypothetical protein [Flavobacterium sp.]RZJ67752.1 MAG: hypothetical protein EOO50_04030 [Flavobacterium sp.]